MCPPQVLSMRGDTGCGRTPSVQFRFVIPKETGIQAIFRIPVRWTIIAMSNPKSWLPSVTSLFKRRQLGAGIRGLFLSDVL